MAGPDEPLASRVLASRIVRQRRDVVVRVLACARCLARFDTRGLADNLSTLADTLGVRIIVLTREPPR